MAVLTNEQLNSKFAGKFVRTAKERARLASKRRKEREKALAKRGKVLRTLEPLLTIDT